MTKTTEAEKLLAERFQELAELREDKLPNDAPQSLQAEVFETIDQIDDAANVDVDELLNVGSAVETADFLDLVVEPEVPANFKK